MRTLSIPASAASAADLSFALDKIKGDIKSIAQELGVSEVLMLTCLKQWCNDNLLSVIHIEQSNHGC